MYSNLPPTRSGVSCSRAGTVQERCNFPLHHVINGLLTWTASVSGRLMSADDLPLFLRRASAHYRYASPLPCIQTDCGHYKCGMQMEENMQKDDDANFATRLLLLFGHRVTLHCKKYPYIFPNVQILRTPKKAKQRSIYPAHQ